VEASEPDVVRPAVAADDPDLAIGQRLDEGDQPCRGAALVVADVDVELQLLEALPERDEALALPRDAIVVPRADATGDAVCQVLADALSHRGQQVERLRRLGVDGEPHAETELGSVLEQRVVPCRTASV